jgi:F-type H+-transporting ATPase subunit gamma
MPSTKEIKSRIKSVKSTKKITKAMELVAASKMKRATSQTLASRLYSSFSWDLLTSLSEKLETAENKFFKKNATPKSLIVLITSNRGLCGGYNAQAIKKVITALKVKDNSCDVITVGKKGDSAMRRIGQNVVATFTEMSDNLKLRDILPLSTHLLAEFSLAKYSEVYVVYTDFVSALTQVPKIRKILPVSREEIKEVIELGEAESNKKPAHCLVEGEVDTLLDTLIVKLVQMQIYQMILESNASEQSARMMAMKNATEAAEEMIEDLTLVFNKARQAGITREISEISAGMASVS